VEAHCTFGPRSCMNTNINAPLGLAVYILALASAGMCPTPPPPALVRFKACVQLLPAPGYRLALYPVLYPDTTLELSRIATFNITDPAPT
jgi:hypothetical protein